MLSSFGTKNVPSLSKICSLVYVTPQSLEKGSKQVNKYEIIPQIRFLIPYRPYRLQAASRDKYNPAKLQQYTSQKPQ